MEERSRQHIAFQITVGHTPRCIAAVKSVAPHSEAGGRNTSSAQGTGSRTSITVLLSRKGFPNEGARL